MAFPDDLPWSAFPASPSLFCTISWTNWIILVTPRCHIFFFFWFAVWGVGGASFSGSCYCLCLDCLSLSQLQKSQVLFISYGLWTLSYFSKDMPPFKVFTPLCFIIRLFTFVISPSWLSGKESIHLLMQETQEMWVWFLGQEDPLRRKWQPIPVFLSGKFHGQRSPASCKELDAAEHTRTYTLKEISTAYLSSCAGLCSALFLQGFCDYFLTWISNLTCLSSAPLFSALTQSPPEFPALVMDTPSISLLVPEYLFIF